MRYILLILIQIFLWLNVQVLSSESYKYGIDVTRIMEEIQPLFPRKENSSNEKKLFHYLEEKLDKLPVQYRILDYKKSDNYHSFSQGYVVDVPGLNDDTILIIVPLNNKDSQNTLRSGSINIATALQLLEIFTNYKPPISIQFLFLGAERGSEYPYPIGSREFINDFVRDSSVALYLDLTAPGDLIEIRKSSTTDQSPRWLVETLAKKFGENELPVSTGALETLAYESGFETSPPVVDVYLESGIPIALLQSSPQIQSSKPSEQWINDFIESLLSFILDYKNGLPQEWERHYFIGTFKDKILVFGETESILLIVLIASSLMFILLMKSRNLHLNLKRFKNHLWTLPLLFFLSFLYLFLTTLIIEELSGLRNYPDLWLSSPLLFILFKLFSALFLYTVFVFTIRGVSLSPSHHFYTYTAFFAIIISLITVMVYNFSYSYFFLWGLLTISLFMMSRNRILKRIAIILTPMPLLIVIYLIVSFPYYEISRFLITSRISGNMFFTILLMPTLMLFSSQNHFLHRFHRHRNSFSNVLSLLTMGLVCVVLLYKIMTVPTFTDIRKQPLNITEKIDLTNSTRLLHLSSTAPAGDINLQLDNFNLTLSDMGREADITAPMLENLLSVTKKSSQFLDRTSLDYTIDAKGSPDLIKINLSSETPLILFNANFPSRASADGKTITFHIGKNPQLPLHLNFIVSRTSSPLMNLQVFYSEFPYRFSMSKQNFSLNKELIVSKSIPWELQ